MTSTPAVAGTTPAGVSRPPRPPARRGRSLDYQASLDGLRAVAVVLVMLYHDGVSWAHAGFWASMYSSS